jgi:hypothetical protein
MMRRGEVEPLAMDAKGRELYLCDAMTAGHVCRQDAALPFRTLVWLRWRSVAKLGPDPVCLHRSLQMEAKTDRPSEKEEAAMNSVTTV